jgi:hypothetical protein
MAGTDDRATAGDGATAGGGATTGARTGADGALAGAAAPVRAEEGTPGGGASITGGGGRRMFGDVITSGALKGTGVGWSSASFHPDSGPLSSAGTPAAGGLGATSATAGSAPEASSTTGAGAGGLMVMMRTGRIDAGSAIGGREAGAPDDGGREEEIRATRRIDGDDADGEDRRRVRNRRSRSGRSRRRRPRGRDPCNRRLGFPHHGVGPGHVVVRNAQGGAHAARRGRGHLGAGRLGDGERFS